MEFVILGRTALRVAGTAVPLGAAKQRGMLAVLLYHVGEAVRAETLVQHLWGERAPAECREQLYTLASRARAALNRADIGKALVRVPSIGGYRLDVDPMTIDYHRFRHMVTDARAAAERESLDTAVALLEAAIELWRDEPLADLRGPRAEHLRSLMNDSLLDAHRQLVDYELKRGRHHSALVRLEPLLRDNDLDEGLAQHRITALCAAGREAEARAFLATFRRRFRAQMRVEPVVDLPATARPARRPGAPRAPSGPRQLPKDIADFTGHGDLLAALDELAGAAAGRASVVVISGMPGVGKTTLATHWAHRQRQRYPDGQLYLNANAYGPMPGVRPEDALGRFLQALDVPPDLIPHGEQERRDRLNRMLTGRRILIVLDNVRDSRQVRPLLTTSETCFTVITSRSRLTELSIREAVPNLTVSPLPEHESIGLLGRMIGAPRADAEPDAVRALARLSGGLPLAVRIVGEHVNERPRAQIAELVAELGTRLLDGEGEDDEASLRTVFAWSCDALDDEATRLFRMLGLFPGVTIGPEAAAAMVGGEPRRIELLLDGLAKAHLVNHDTVRRYRFHDLLRLYAADRAAREEPVEERREAMRRLLDWYLLSAANATTVLAPHMPTVPDLPSPKDVAPQSFGTEEDALRWCDTERANLVAMARWAADNGFHRHGWQLPGAAYEVFNRYGRQDIVLELLRPALSAVRADGHEYGEIGILNNLGTTYFYLHDYRRAVEHFQAGLRLAQSLDFLEGNLTCSHNLATVHLQSGDVDTAVQIYERVLSARRSLDEPGEQAYTLQRLGDAYRRLGRYQPAESRYREALEIWERIGWPRGQGTAHTALGALYLETGRPARALEHCRRAQELHGRTRDESALCDTLSTAAEAEVGLGMGADAVRDAERAVAISQEIGDSPRRCRALAALARALAATGGTGPARVACGQALELFKQIEEPDAGELRARLSRLGDSLGPSAEG